ncbi:MAG: ATP-dependent helicase [Acidothermus sp.]|nr:ATP-dependent helicase [Acidothermus sp.]
MSGAVDVLDEDQRAAVEVAGGPVCIIAGPGTGKTRTLAYRIAHLVRCGAAAPSHILALTFTTRAARELAERLRGLGVDGVHVSTFHSAAARQLRYFWPRLIGGRFPTLLADKTDLLREVVPAVGGTDRLDLVDIAGEIEWMKVVGRPPEEYEKAVETEGRVPPASPSVVAAAYREYEKLKDERHLLDFEDLLLLLSALLETESEAAELLARRYRVFVVDEYQDVNAAEQRLLDAWLGTRDDICVVGDPRQSIYGFAGASARYLEDFSRRFPHAAVFSLVRNYRSTPEVVAVANRLADGTAPMLRATRPPGPDPIVRDFPDEAAELDGTVRAIRALLDGGVAPAEIAVLCRVQRRVNDFAAALRAAGLRCVTSGARTPSLRRPDAVTVATLHAAKGLEWDAVFLTGWAEGWFPAARARSPEALAEERRLAFVGITRARRWLTVSWPAATRDGQPTRPMSRFVAEAFGRVDGGPDAAGAFRAS